MTKVGIATNHVPQRCLQGCEKSACISFICVYIYVYVCINKNFQSKSAEVSFQSPFSPIPTLLSPFRLFFTENKKRHRFQSFGLQTVFKIPSTLMFLASGFQTIAILPKRATCLQIVCEITFKSNVFPEHFYF